jgi:very-short-patch-repair endonuclease
LAPETLQLRVFTRDGVYYARLDLAWPSCLLAVEADGRETHDKPAALYQDRVRQNNLMLAGWTVLRFTWDDVYRRPSWVVAQVSAALQKLRLTHASDTRNRAFLEVFGG